MALLTVRGTGAAPGIGLGRAHIYGSPADPLIGNGSSPTVLPVAERVAEVERLRQSLEAARVDLERLADAVSKQIGPTEAAVFEAHALFLQDSALTEPMEEAIRHGGQPAVCALEQTMEAAARDMEALNDVYLSARAADLRDVKDRVARLLGASSPGDLSTLSAGTVVIARDLTPSDTVRLRPGTVSGIVLAEGTPTAHAAILARGLGLPLVVGAGAAIWQVEPGQQLILDGTDGIVLVEPQAQECEEYRQLVVRRQRPESVVRGEKHSPARTNDGRRVELMANVSSVAEARLAVESDAEGVGLLRTEFLLAAPTRGAATGATVPDEDELAEAYGAISELMGERPIVVRTMDAGGDKPLPFLDFGHEANPFLG